MRRWSVNVNTALGVSKPAWLRVIGWLSLALFLVAPAIALTETVTRYRIPRTVWPGYCLFVCFVTTPLWVLGTVIYKVQRTQAQMTAAQLMAKNRQLSERLKPPEVK
jgi:hypothetical protein